MKEECLRSYGDSERCSGKVGMRISDSGLTEIWECAFHQEESLERNQKNRERYPDSPIPPAWFGPTSGGVNEYGERWDSDY